jgi:RimJ/RimL family protein N-acetyltransferase
MPIPFETERCLVRPFEERDIEAFMAYRNNLDWMQYQGFKGKKYQEYKAALLQQPKFFEGVQLAIVLRQTGILIGDLYLKLEKNACWIGYTIAPEFARQGFAFEVVTQVIFELAQSGIKRIQAGVETGNTASIALLKKLGFTQMGIEENEAIFLLNVAEI